MGYFGNAERRHSRNWLAFSWLVLEDDGVGYSDITPEIAVAKRARSRVWAGNLRFISVAIVDPQLTGTGGELREMQPQGPRVR